MQSESETMSNIVRDAAEQPVFAVVGTLLQFVSTPDQSASDLSVMRCEIPAGALIPLHSHGDPEVFYLTRGSFEVFLESSHSQGWQSASAGDVVTIPCGVRHAIRNLGDTSATAVLVAGAKLYQFFCELADPIAPNTPPPAPTPAVMEKLLRAAARYGLWIGSPAENAAIGLQIG